MLNQFPISTGVLGEQVQLQAVYEPRVIEAEVLYVINKSILCMSCPFKNLAPPHPAIRY